MPATVPSDLSKTIREAIPKHCFQSNLLYSLFFLLFDLAILSSALFVYPLYVHGIVSRMIYWNFYGFFAWSLFVVGHDCGHGSFSSSAVINGICGHICHSVLLVPFYPWARSHYQHHRYHNCKDMDRSHPWLLKEEFAERNPLFKTLINTLLGPLVGFWVYLFWGMSPDGSHLVWFGRLYAGASVQSKVGCVVSSTCVLAWTYVVYVYTGSFVGWWTQYGGVIAVCYFWLFAVTWFQHHEATTLVYAKDKWTFVKGAVETIDRRVGYGLDVLHHHISDCHLIHHFFFREIPHYKLREATDAIKKIQDASPDTFKFVDHSAYPLKYIADFCKTYVKLGFTGWNWGK
jgi:omega-3 fatty acid desaturase (delta-15 desaturase)